MLADPNLVSAFNDESALARPLCVDLDGTLVTTDTLWEAVVALIRQRPWTIVVVPLWLFGGRASFKNNVSSRVALDASHLPYRWPLVEALRDCKGKRALVLATAADRRIADAVAGHLGLFDVVYASDGAVNLKASAKRDLLLKTYASQGFDYVGDSSADESVLEAATRGYLVGASSGAARVAERLDKVTLVSRRPGMLKALIKQLRPHQWAKNGLVLLPVFLAPSTLSFDYIGKGLLAAGTFSLCASAGYVFNDLLDIEADRAHATKVKRPFASGALPVILGPPLFVGLLVVSFGTAIVALPSKFVEMLVLYFVGTLSYSLYLKRLLLLDVLVLAGLYAHRILAGGMATGIKVSTWLLGFSMFFFTSLAFAKRYVELRALTADNKVKNRGYFRTDLEMVTSMGTASGYIAALVFMLYVDSGAVRATYREPTILWLILPVLLYWLGRIWLLAGRGQMQDDPVKFAIKDRVSIICGAVMVAIAALARFAPVWVSMRMR